MFYKINTRFYTQECKVGCFLYYLGKTLSEIGSPGKPCVRECSGIWDHLQNFSHPEEFEKDLHFPQVNRYAAIIGHLQSPMVHLPHHLPVILRIWTLFFRIKPLEQCLLCCTDVSSSDQGRTDWVCCEFISIIVVWSVS